MDVPDTGENPRLLSVAWGISQNMVGSVLYDNKLLDIYYLS